MISRSPWLWGACGAGLVHAGFSAYWAFGGQWLLETVGSWAVDWTRNEPTAAAVALSVIALIKLTGAIVPLLTQSEGAALRAARRAASWTAAVVLVAYGLVNIVGASLALGGAVKIDGPKDEAALYGHALLWDPLFLLWGLLLAGGLWTVRRRQRC